MYLRTHIRRTRGMRKTKRMPKSRLNLPACGAVSLVARSRLSLTGNHRMAPRGAAGGTRVPSSVTSNRCPGRVPLGFKGTPPAAMWSSCGHMATTYVRMYVHTYIHTYVRMYIRTYIHTYIRTYVCTYVHTYIRTYVHTYVHTYIHRYVCTYVRT